MIIIYDEIEENPLHICASFEFADDKLNVKKFEGDLFKVDSGAWYLKGRAEVSCGAVCARCGQEMTMAFTPEISINIETSPLNADKTEYEMTDDEGDIFYSEPDSLRLDELLRQEILLQLPVRCICGEGCEGFGEYADEGGKLDMQIPLTKLAALKEALKEK